MQQRMDHIELKVGANDSELEGLRRRLLLVESNVNNVGGNLQELVRAEVTVQLKHVGVLDIRKDEDTMISRPITE